MTTLVIGDKRYSSWSLRPWLALSHAGIPFHEEIVRLNRPDTAARIASFSPSGRVPVLIDGDLHVWESLAICEWAAERAPSLWPADPNARALARAVSAEMHSGFAALRREHPMDLQLSIVKRPSDAVMPEVERVQATWRACRSRFAGDGEFLFGAFSIADCMFAPVVTRFRSYGIEQDGICSRYSENVLAHPAMSAWCEAAMRELPASEEPGANPA